MTTPFRLKNEAVRSLESASWSVGWVTTHRPSTVASSEHSPRVRLGRCAGCGPDVVQLGADLVFCGVRLARVRHFISLPRAHRSSSQTSSRPISVPIACAHGSAYQSRVDRSSVSGRVLRAVSRGALGRALGAAQEQRRTAQGQGRRGPAVRTLTPNVREDAIGVYGSRYCIPIRTRIRAGRQGSCLN